MRSRRLLRYATLGALALLIGFLWSLWPRSPGDPGIRTADAASPTPMEVAQQVAPGGPGSWNDARHTTFEQLFTARYRSRGFAVRARFRQKGPAQMLCAALLPRWDMAHVADQFHREAGQAFGTDYPIDIYETYMTAQKLKVGELRTDQASRRVHIVFNPPYGPRRIRRPVRPVRFGVPWSLDPSYMWRPPEAW